MSSRLKAIFRKKVIGGITARRRRAGQTRGLKVQRLAAQSKMYMRNKYNAYRGFGTRYRYRKGDIKNRGMFTTRDLFARRGRRFA